MTLAQLLRDPGKHSWNHWVFIDDRKYLGPETGCLVMDTFGHEVAEDGKTPKPVSEISYRDFLQITDPEGIAENLRQK